MVVHLKEKTKKVQTFMSFSECLTFMSFFSPSHDACRSHMWSAALQQVVPHGSQRGGGIGRVAGAVPVGIPRGGVNLSPLFDLTATFRSASSSSTQLLHPHSVTCWKVPIPVGITVYLLTWGPGHLRCLVCL